MCSNMVCSVCTYVNNTPVFTMKENLSINYDDVETLVIDAGKDKNLIINLVHRTPNGSIKTFHEY